MPIWLNIGAGAFGLVIGWMTYFILRRAKPSAISDLATIIGTLGGASIIGLFDPKGPLFASYALGLAIGFFAYFSIYSKIVGKSAIRETLVKKAGDEGTILE
jgi:hypothetical protein